MGNLKINFHKKSSPSEQFLHINRSKRHIDANLRVFHLKDGDFFIEYVPALNASSYGKTQEEAIKMIGEVTDDYFESLVDADEPQMNQELKIHGWTQRMYRKKNWENTTYVDKNGVLKNFNLPEDTHIEEEILELA